MIIIPIKKCKADGKPGFKWGDSGKCYTYTPGNEESIERARKKAEAQGAAAHASGYEGSDSIEHIETIEKSEIIDYKEEDIIIYKGQLGIIKAVVLHD